MRMQLVGAVLISVFIKVIGTERQEFREIDKRAKRNSDTNKGIRQKYLTIRWARLIVNPINAPF